MSSILNNIVISGASSGIGRCVSEALLEADAQVVGLARFEKQAPIQHPNFQPIKVDFSKINELEALLKSELKEKPVSAVICSAGLGQFNELEQFSVAQMAHMLDVNFLSQAILVKTLLPKLKAQGHGHIIFIGSEAALQGAKKGSLYCASKFAVRGFAQSLRAECASAGVAVTIVNPGFVNTEFFDDLSFKYGEHAENVIDKQLLSEWIIKILDTPPHCVIEELNLQPLKRVIASKS